MLGLITDLLMHFFPYIYHLVGICDDRRVMLCTCCAYVRWIDSTLGIVHMLRMTVKGLWQDVVDAQKYIQGHMHSTLALD